MTYKIGICETFKFFPTSIVESTGGMVRSYKWFLRWERKCDTCTRIYKNTCCNLQDVNMNMGVLILDEE
jgi:hypothetical protein